MTEHCAWSVLQKKESFRNRRTFCLRVGIDRATKFNNYGNDGVCFFFLMHDFWFW